MRLGDRKVWITQGVDSMFGQPASTMDLTTIHIQGIPGHLPLTREVQMEWMQRNRGFSPFATKAHTLDLLNTALKHYQYIEFEEINETIRIREKSPE